METHERSVFFDFSVLMPSSWQKRLIEFSFDIHELLPQYAEYYLLNSCANIVYLFRIYAFPLRRHDSAVSGDDAVFLVDDDGRHETGLMERCAKLRSLMYI